jgi:hypothetical protein
MKESAAHNRVKKVLYNKGYVPAAQHPNNDPEAVEGSTTYQHPKTKEMVHVWGDGSWYHQTQPGNTNNERDSSGIGSRELVQRFKGEF